MDVAGYTTINQLKQNQIPSIEPRIHNQHEAKLGLTLSLKRNCCSDGVL